MPKYECTFKRYEIKYLVNSEQKQRLMELANEYMRPDEFGRSTICNVYFDTPDKRVIRRSLEKPLYKEKLRVRSYGTATKDSIVFVELKKKFDGVVYKRRVCMTEAEAFDYLCGNTRPAAQGQIVSEIDYFVSHYKGLAPSVYLSYEREAFYGKDDSQFRITFDDDILWRDTDLSLSSSCGGEPLLPSGYTLMELKLASGMPLWLSHELCRQGLFNTSFSKYGNAYLSMIDGKEERRIICA